MFLQYAQVPVELQLQADIFDQHKFMYF